MGHVARWLGRLGFEREVGTDGGTDGGPDGGTNGNCLERVGLYSVGT